MRILLLFLLASCLSLLSLGAAAASRVDSQAAMRTGPLVCSMASVAAAATAVAKAALTDDTDDSRIVAPGDDGVHPDDVAESVQRPGYCNIWSADLLDPPDVLDEIEESSALFAVPTVRLQLPSDDVAQARHGSAPPLPAAPFKPPILQR